jgi:signal transduction histidine kinase
LRTPLTVILGEAEMTLRQSGDKLPAPLRKSIETIQARARRLNRRIEDLLRVARSESGRIDLNLARIDVASALNEAYEEVAALARQRNMAAEIDAGAGGLFVNGDRDWLRQVFAGLIANAIKYSPSGEIISVKATATGPAVEIAISDRGCGVSDEELPHVFDRFFRGKNQPSTNESSHGVGLALAKWVIEEHNGKIKLESPSRLYNPGDPEHGKGLTVAVSLARVEAAGTQTAA